MPTSCHFGPRVTFSPTDSTIPAIHALHLAEVSARFGVAPEVLFRGSGLDAKALAEPAAKLAVSDMIALVERARDLTGEPGLGFHVGLQMRIASHGYLGLAAMTASTVRDALAIAIRFAPTRTNALSLRLDTEGDEARLVLVEHVDLGPARDPFVFALLSGIWTIGNALTGLELANHGPSGAASADVTFPEPPYFARFRAIAPPVRFEEETTCLRFARAILDRPLVTGDPAASRLTLEQCEKELEALAPRASSRVRALLPSPDGGFRSLDEVARAMHVSARTLKRRLADEGTSFSALLERARRARAEELLRSPRRTLDEIASELGYGDVASFSRAFRRWTGSAPGAWRKMV